MTSSLLDRVKKKPPATAEEFVAEADALPAPTAASVLPSSPQPLPPGNPLPAIQRRPDAGAAQDLGDAPLATLNPAAQPHATFNLRLNDYEMELLRRVAAAHSVALGVKVSMQTLAKNGTVEYLERLAHSYRLLP